MTDFLLCIGRYVVEMAALALKRMWSKSIVSNTWRR